MLFAAAFFVTACCCLAASDTRHGGAGSSAVPAAALAALEAPTPSGASGKLLLFELVAHGALNASAIQLECELAGVLVAGAGSSGSVNSAPAESPPLGGSRFRVPAAVVSLRTRGDGGSHSLLISLDAALLEPGWQYQLRARLQPQQPWSAATAIALPAQRAAAAPPQLAAVQRGDVAHDAITLHWSDVTVEDASESGGGTVGYALQLQVAADGSAADGSAAVDALNSTWLPYTRALTREQLHLAAAAEAAQLGGTSAASSSDPLSALASTRVQLRVACQNARAASPWTPLADFDALLHDPRTASAELSVLAPATASRPCAYSLEVSGLASLTTYRFRVRAASGSSHDTRAFTTGAWSAPSPRLRTRPLPAVLEAAARTVDGPAEGTAAAALAASPLSRVRLFDLAPLPASTCARWDAAASLGMHGDSSCCPLCFLASGAAALQSLELEGAVAGTAAAGRCAEAGGHGLVVIEYVAAPDAVLYSVMIGYASALAGRSSRGDRLVVALSDAAAADDAQPATIVRLPPHLFVAQRATAATPPQPAAATSATQQRVLGASITAVLRAWGAGGGGSGSEGDGHCGTGGAGAFARASIPITSISDAFAAFVGRGGERGGRSQTFSAAPDVVPPGRGGWPDGADGGLGVRASGAGGGGASAVYKISSTEFATGQMAARAMQVSEHVVTRYAGDGSLASSAAGGNARDPFFQGATAGSGDGVEWLAAATRAADGSGGGSSSVAGLSLSLLRPFFAPLIIAAGGGGAGAGDAERLCAARAGAGGACTGQPARERRHHEGRRVHDGNGSAGGGGGGACASEAPPASAPSVAHAAVELASGGGLAAADTSCMAGGHAGRSATSTDFYLHPTLDSPAAAGALLQGGPGGSGMFGGGGGGGGLWGGGGGGAGRADVCAGAGGGGSSYVHARLLHGLSGSGLPVIRSAAERAARSATQPSRAADCTASTELAETPLAANAALLPEPPRVQSVGPAHVTLTWAATGIWQPEYAGSTRRQLGVVFVEGDEYIVRLQLASAPAIVCGRVRAAAARQLARAAQAADDELGAGSEALRSIVLRALPLPRELCSAAAATATAAAGRSSGTIAAATFSIVTVNNGVQSAASPGTALSPLELQHVCGIAAGAWQLVTRPTLAASDASATHPPALSGASLIALGSGLLLFGGRSVDGLSAALWRYCPGDSTWVRLRDGTSSSSSSSSSSGGGVDDPAPRTRHAAVALPDGMLIYGGESAAGGAALADTWRWEAHDAARTDVACGELACRLAGTPDSALRRSIACAATNVSSPPQAIPSSGSSSPLYLRAAGPSDATSGRCIEDVEVSVLLLHPCPSDLSISLAGPGSSGAAAASAGLEGDLQRELAATHFIPLFGSDPHDELAGSACPAANDHAFRTVWAAATAGGAGQPAAPPHSPLIFADTAPRSVRECCASSAVDALELLSASGAAAAPTAGVAPRFTALRGRYRPLSSLRERFHGARAEGWWTLRLVDRRQQVAALPGQLLAWSISVTSRPCQQVGSWRQLALGAGAAPAAGSVAESAAGPGPRIQPAMAVRGGTVYLWGGRGATVPLYESAAAVRPFDALWRLGGDGAWQRVAALSVVASPALPHVLASAELARVVDGRRGEGGACAPRRGGEHVCWLSQQAAFGRPLLHAPAALASWDSTRQAWLPLRWQAAGNGSAGSDDDAGAAPPAGIHTGNGVAQPGSRSGAALAIFHDGSGCGAASSASPLAQGSGQCAAGGGEAAFLFGGRGVRGELRGELWTVRLPQYSRQ